MADPGIGTSVRYWLHYSNLASSFYKQYGGAKALQDQYANQIIESLQRSRMENAIMQIGGGSISIADKRTPHQLSLTKIQQLLHEYFKQRGGADETKQIMLFLNANRGFTMTKTLKKHGLAPPSQGGMQAGVQAGSNAGLLQGP